jgi:hypothetical protein
MKRSMIALLVATLPIACGGTVSTPSGTSTGTSTSTSTSTSTGTGTSTSVCTFGQDQTCNDSLEVSALWGSCKEDGTCACKAGFEVNPNTGRCRPVTDGGPPPCGAVPCKDDEFCVERVHDQDAGPVPSTWQCQVYFTCMEHTCACALQNFVSASCVAPVCVSDDPVMLRCDDLN